MSTKDLGPRPRVSQLEDSRTSSPFRAERHAKPKPSIHEIYGVPPCWPLGSVVASLFVMVSFHCRAVPRPPELHRLDRI